MSKYTTEVRYICEHLFDNAPHGADDIDRIISATADQIVGTTYPIFDTSYRGGLNRKIVQHYYTREIGYETVALWKFKLQTRMNEIMPYYNQMYQSAALEFNPLYDYESNVEHSGSSKGTGASTSKGSSSSTANSTLTSTSDKSENQLTKNQDTPQSTIENLKDGKYLTGASIADATSKSEDSSTGKTENSGTDTNESSSTSVSEDTFTEKIIGKRGTASYSSLLKEFRQTFLNIDMMIIDELEDLFMQMW